MVCELVTGALLAVRAMQLGAEDDDQPQNRPTSSHCTWSLKPSHHPMPHGANEAEEGIYLAHDAKSFSVMLQVGSDVSPFAVRPSAPEVIAEILPVAREGDDLRNLQKLPTSTL